MKPVVLLVTCDLELAYAIEGDLARFGCRIADTARGEAEALHAQRDFRPDVVIIDGALPGWARLVDGMAKSGCRRLMLLAGKQEASLLMPKAIGASPCIVQSPPEPTRIRQELLRLLPDEMKSPAAA